MTGARLCRRILERAGIETDVRRGAANVYLAGECVIELSAACFHGTSRKDLTISAHECGHAEQEHVYGWIVPGLRWLLGGRLLLEWDASQRARRMMLAEGLQPHADVLDAMWRGYLVPALWQTLILIAVLGCWFMVRRF